MRLWPALTLLLHGGAPAFAHESEAVTACTALVMDYAYYRDRYDAAPYADLFAEDAVLTVLGVDYEGRAAIKARMLDASDKPPSRHHMTTIKITPVDDSTATGVSYVTVYSAPASAERPAAVNAFTTMGEYHDTFTRTDDGWKILRREYKPAFVPATP